MRHYGKHEATNRRTKARTQVGARVRSALSTTARTMPDTMRPQLQRQPGGAFTHCATKRAGRSVRPRDRRCASTANGRSGPGLRPAQSRCIAIGTRAEWRASFGEGRRAVVLALDLTAPPIRVLTGVARISTNIPVTFMGDPKGLARRLALPPRDVRTASRVCVLRFSSHCGLPGRRDRGTPFRLWLPVENNRPILIRST